MTVHYTIGSADKYCSARLDTMASMILAGRAVSSAAQVRCNLDRAAWIVGAYDTELRGVIVLKRPLASYQRRVAEQSNTDLRAFALELGYLAVPNAPLGVARGLLNNILMVAAGEGMWLTTAPRVGMNRILARAGFNWRGSYIGENQNQLSVWTRRIDQCA